MSSPPTSSLLRALHQRANDLQKTIQNHQKASDTVTKAQLAFLQSIVRAFESLAK